MSGEPGSEGAPRALEREPLWLVPDSRLAAWVRCARKADREAEPETRRDAERAMVAGIAQHVLHGSKTRAFLGESRWSTQAPVRTRTSSSEALFPL